ncbi:exoribonuclease R [Vibrio sinaloensis]|uniref:exoribonuclease R n=1 Tax=Photobacterium sp. (strain ATCC 43367) TaxID=379097 RepID=UPI002063C07B|nr:exoribonuclease R [Vibrio sinaloensis]UPQ89771.1 exoribonuclease R [Vibrio sinaloensis]
MSLDYTYDALSSMRREELEELSLRMIHRLVPEESMSELFTFDSDEVTSPDKQQEAQFDAMLRMSAIALSELPALFSESENKQQNILRMQRLLLWHFYAVSFHLEQAIALETHCNHVEVLLKQPPQNALEWVTTLTALLRQYAQVAQKKSNN